MKEAFQDWNPQEEALIRVQQCEAIVREYAAQGLKLTLRQLYYQLVSKDWIPNTEKSYKKIGQILSNARLAGLIDWEIIEDRGRQPRNPPEYDNLADLVEAAIHSYRLPRWEGQPYYAELWVEKEALAGVLQPLARQFHVTLMVNKGYSSQSAMYDASKRILHANKDTKIFYLGDHDPSGEDMVRDVQDRLNMYTREEVNVEVEKLALTTAQVKKFKPPPNPAKLTDSRARAYIAKHGASSWEVDALNPRQLQQIIRAAFEEVIDQEMMDEIIEREEEDKDKLRGVVL
jgi:hypothetical protein